MYRICGSSEVTEQRRVCQRDKEAPLPHSAPPHQLPPPSRIVCQGVRQSHLLPLFSYFLSLYLPLSCSVSLKVSPRCSPFPDPLQRRMRTTPSAIGALAIRERLLRPGCVLSPFFRSSPVKAGDAGKCASLEAHSIRDRKKKKGTWTRYKMRNTEMG